MKGRNLGSSKDKNKNSDNDSDSSSSSYQPYIAGPGGAASAAVSAGASAFHEKGSVHAVVQYDLATGEFIARFDHQKAAASATGLCVGGIGKCCRGQKNSFGGFGWKFAELGGAIAAVSSRTGKPVEQYDLATKKTIARFKSYVAASEATNVGPESIGNCVRGKQTHAGGWGWRTPGSGGADGAGVGVARASSSSGSYGKRTSR